ncbi:MAG: PSD1 and planctomycete cytochrome C domain-containing protein [Planctomycetota bacterium]|nr:PSD1 and planctomycete cytochrome C domain-containing protein [Planctomycetota bacterium]MDA1158897.1 PSD1 and planctomycete cytochrome C domain-containing protein [Planctomycetota bacterium]
MIKNMIPKILPLLALSAVFNASVVAHGAEPSDGEKLFALQVKSLFAEKCIACHGEDPDEIAGGFDMRSREAMLKGGESFAEETLIPGNGEKSFLYIATTRSEEGFEMPPKEAERLTQEQQWWIRDWIAAGAPWPDETRVAEIQNKYAEGVIVETSGGLSDDWTNRRYKPEHLWAYQPLKVEEVPEVSHPVDWFVDRKLKEAGLTPAPVAEPRELARRISFGVTGLPPLPRDSTHFETAAKNDVEAAVLDYARRLMATPHYGEHFGRQWLDVARYADSAGFANDYSRPNAWRYRDYVIRSFNTDKPYDDFIREQIAGDEIDEADSEKLVATGFLRMGPWEQTGMSVFRITRQQWLDDVTDSVGQAFLGHALQCAKCHDHKFDPIPTRDYYSMMAVFSTTQFVERDAPFTTGENLTGFKSATEWTQAKIAAYSKERNELNARIEQNRKKETGSARVGDNGLDPGDEASLARMNKNISRHNWEYDKTSPIAFSVYTGHTIQRGNVGNRITMPDNLWGKNGYLEEDTILTGGDAYTRGDAVEPGPLSAAEKLGGMTVAAFPDGQGKRRLALAEWIIDRKNPLTARVMVNRVWAWHFGKGLAGNPNNFGATGKLPTHPALLDFLANWFMENDWSVKKLNELILTSATYRRSSRHEDADTLAEKDSGRDFYSTYLPRRLTAEELRDSMLAASGELNRQVGGIPCRPDINLEVAMQPRQIMGGTASVYEPDPRPEQRNRRSVYAEKIRGLRDPFLEAFNQPGPDKSCELRETSTVAPQALTLLNAEEVQDRSLALAARLTKELSDDTAIVKRAFELALGRGPTHDELKACLAHWSQATQEESGKHYEVKKISSRVKRTVMAEKTGEPYDFIEFMPAYENYVPDLQPAQTDARTRGLATVCLVIFNLNEFAYID